MKIFSLKKFLTICWLTILVTQANADLWDEVEHGYADSDGVSIHYTTVGEGPLVVMIHGFPDFWYSWRHQMEGLKDSFKVVAIDQRGYNLSDKPEGNENYSMRHLVGDVAAVIRHLGEEKATIVEMLTYWNERGLIYFEMPEDSRLPFAKSQSLTAGYKTLPV